MEYILGGFFSYQIGKKYGGTLFVFVRIERLLVKVSDEDVHQIGKCIFVI